MPPAKSILWLAATLIAAFFAEAAIYRQGWYYKYLEPSSAAAAVELDLYWLKRFRPPHRPEVMIIGDSRMAEGFSADQANLESGRRNISFWNEGIPGSSPRLWYYFLRDADPTRRRFQAIVIALDYYNDVDQNDDQSAHIADLNYLIARLRPSDIYDFATSMRDPPDQRTAFIGATLKGTVVSRDAREFLNGISSRIAASKDARERGLGFLNGYLGRPEDLQGLSVNFQTRTITFPPNVSDQRQYSVREGLLPNLPPHTGATTRFRMLWLGRILDLYRNSPTRIVFIETSRGPLPQPERPGPRTFLNHARTYPNVIVLDEFAFRNLETPETYFDGYHLNRKGRELFTAQLTHLLVGVI